MNAGIILPNQLFEANPLFRFAIDTYFIIEESLFFRYLAFHKSKLVYHRATMKFYESYLRKLGKKVEYIESNDNRSDVRILIDDLAAKGYRCLYIVEPVDDWLERRINKKCRQHDIFINYLSTPMFLFTSNQLSEFLEKIDGDKKILQTNFYIQARKKFKILIDKGKPLGNKWTYDALNRKKLPNKFPLPDVNSFNTEFLDKAAAYVNKNFNNNYGTIPEKFYFPLNFAQAKFQLVDFVNNRLHYFGHFQDAVDFRNPFLFHSGLSAALNIGLITPRDVIKVILKSYNEINLPIQSVEGFIRQIIGWREYVRMIYQFYGRKIRTSNFFGFSKGASLKKFFHQNTEIYPADKVLEKLNQIAYNHHIERLMILGNLMLLLEIHPDEVYEFFMTNYIDAYDWVMVPNVYGMSQFADGGFMATKPYFSSSNYILKMSSLKKDIWCEKWDTLFWAFLIKHYEKLKSNARIRNLLKHLERFSSEQKIKILDDAELIKKEILSQ